jgi:membrane-associated phospholipid phosphatase
VTISEAVPPERSSVAPHLAPHPTARFAGAAVGFAAVFWSIYVVFVTTEPGQRLENTALVASALRADTTRADSLAYLSGVSVASLVAAMAIVALVGLVRRRPGLGVLAVGVMGVSAVLAEVLKAILPRPELVDGPAWILRNSFPSGTATVAASVGIAALMVAPDRLRWLVLLAAAAVTAVVGQATQVTGWHRASDALGGVVLAASVGCAALLVLARIHHVQPSVVGRVHRRVYAMIWIVAVAAIALGAAILAIFLAFPLLRAPDDAESVALHTASDLIAFGLSTIAIAAFAWVIQPYTLGTTTPPAIPDTVEASVVEAPADEAPRDEPPATTPDDAAG